MNVTKSEVLELLGEFPEQVEIEELIYRLYLLEKIRAGERDITSGRTVLASEVRERVREWRK